MIKLLIINKKCCIQFNKTNLYLKKGLRYTIKFSCVTRIMKLGRECLSIN